MDRRTFLAVTASASIATGLSRVSAVAAASSPLPEWHLYIEQPNQSALLAASFTLPESGASNIKKSLAGFDVAVSIHREQTAWIFVATVTSKEQGRNVFLSLVRNYSTDSQPVNFNGPLTDSAIYRQSPHEPKDHPFGRIVMQPVPLVALNTTEGLEVAICDTPAHFDNFTTQTYDLSNQRLVLSSGDNSLIWNSKTRSFEPSPDESEMLAEKMIRVEAHYFPLDNGKEHRMEGIILKTPGAKLADLRPLVNLIATKHWSQGSIKDLLGSTFFSTAYMNLRVNETGQSQFWVVPAIEYANKQYSRDAFWISMVLPPDYARSCFENEATYDSVFTGAERQLFTLIWAYRSYIDGASVDKNRVEKILRIIEAQAPNASYCGFSTKTRILGCFHGWADIVAFDRDDTVSNNQGLFVTALMCARAMGIEPQVSIDQALNNYRNLFNPAIHAYPMSYQRKDILAVDPLMGDLLAQVYLGHALLPTEHVLAHYETMIQKAKTKFGFKVFCAPDGSYLKADQYNSREFKSPLVDFTDGSYQRGGSWYLYDMQMLMAAHLHGAKDAEDWLIWRTKLEFSLGGTTHEHIDTVTGVANKPNMGWNSAAYGLWSRLIKQGKATDHFFKEIDALRTGPVANVGAI